MSLSGWGGTDLLSVWVLTIQSCRSPGRTKAEKRQTDLSHSLLEPNMLLLSCPWTLGSLAFGLQFTCPKPQPLSLWAMLWILRDLQLGEMLWDFSASIINPTSFPNKSPHAHVHPIGSISLGNPERTVWQHAWNYLQGCSPLENVSILLRLF